MTYGPANRGSNGLMKNPSGFSMCAGVLVLVGVVALVTALAPCGSPGAWAGSGSAPGVTSACATIIVQSPAVNSSLFQKVCSEPSFQSAFELWGASNFSFGNEGGGTVPFAWFWQFAWVAPCTNDSFGTQNCMFQEYWLGSPTTGGVSGPFVMQYPEVCFCGGLVKHPAPASPFPGGLPSIALGSGLLVGVGVAIWRSRGTRRPSDYDTY